MNPVVPHPTGAETDQLRFQVSRDPCTGQLQVDAATRKTKKPVEVKEGSVTVRIYKTKWRDKKRRKAYHSHTLIWRDGFGRHREKRASLDKAKIRASEIAGSILDGQLANLEFGEADRASLRRARELLRPIGNPALEVVAGIYTQCVQKLPAGVTLDQAINYYNDQHPAGIIPKTIPQIVEEFFLKRPMGKKWKRILAKMLERFSKQFPSQLPELRAREIDDWLDSLKLGLRSRRNYHGALVGLVTFAKDRGYVVKDWNVLHSVSNPKAPAVEVNLYSPDELVRLLHVAEKTASGRRLLPFIAITAFAGVRHGEMNEEKIAALDWSNIDFEAKAIEINQSVAKTELGRTVDMPDNLIAWIAPYARPKGKICTLANTSNALCRLRAKAGIKGPKKNALRKSFITYSKAISRNIEAVADQAGNSPAVIRKHYLRTNTRLKADAVRWFTIMPTRAELLPLFAWAKES